MNNEEKKFQKTNINWYPGHINKTRKEIVNNLNLVDIIYEVIDARMPISSRIVDLDNLVKDKPRIIIVTKYDLCDQKITDQLLDSLKYPYLTVNLKDNKNNITKELVNKTYELLKHVNEKRNDKGLKSRALRAMVIGIPNSGKSTLINKLVNRNATNTGNKPGVTKNISWIRINKDLELMDTPGILWPRIDNQVIGYNLASLSSIPLDILNKEDICAYIISFLKDNYSQLLLDKYGISDISDIISVYDTIGRKRGCLVKGGLIDYDKVYNLVINDFNEGRIGKITIDR